MFTRTIRLWATALSLAVGTALAGAGVAPGDAHAFHGAVHYIVNDSSDRHDADTADLFCDANPAPGNQFECTMRAAVEQTEAHFGADLDSITVLANPVLDLGELGVNGPLTISGDRVISRDDAAPSFRIFNVFGDLTLQGLTISNGDAAGAGLAGVGGGILYAGGVNTELTLRDVHLLGNSAAVEGGGVGTQGDSTRSLVIEDSVIGSPASPNVADGPGFASGGGIAVGQNLFSLSGSEVVGNTASDGGAGIALGGDDPTDPSTEIVDTTIADNTAGSAPSDAGGGISSARDLTLRRSTVSGNSATEGAGIRASLDPITLINSTVSGNTAIGASAGTAGIAVDDQGATILHSTIASNSGPSADPEGISGSGGTITLTGTILDNEGDENCNPGLGAPTTFDSGGHNLDSGSTCGLSGPGDLSDTHPALQPLADNGGPTETHALLASSPAVDAAASNGLATDQRGASRTSDFFGVPNTADGSDVGAFELAAPPPPPPTPGPGTGGGSGGALFAPSPSNLFALGKLKRNKKKGIAFLLATFPGPGEVGLAGKGVKNIGRAAGGARKSAFTTGGRMKLRIKPAKKGKRARKVRKRLKKKGKAKLKVRVTFVPTGGVANTEGRKVKLVRK